MGAGGGGGRGGGEGGRGISLTEEKENNNFATDYFQRKAVDSDKSVYHVTQIAAQLYTKRTV